MWAAIALVISAIIAVLGYSFNHRLSQKTEALAKKKQVYEEISASLSIFVCGRDATNRRKGFLDEYAKLWLWAPDPVVQAANELLHIMIEFDASDNQQQRDAKRAYADFMIEMRRDLGFSKTVLKHSEYIFGGFGD